MNQHPQHPQHAPFGDELPPAHGHPPALQADELFSHGVLHIFHETDPAARARRVERVMSSLAPMTADTTAGCAAPGRRRRRFARFLGRGSLLAAIIAGVVFLASPATTTSYASLDAALTAMRGPGDRRYEVRAQIGEAQAPEEKPHATIDSSAPDRMLLSLRRPDGGTVIVGRDAQGEWALTPEGDVERGDPRRAWPGWAIQNGESLVADSIDRWLEAAAETYTFSKPELRPVPGRENLTASYILGVRKKSEGPLGHRLRGADRLELWIDAKSSIVERMELSWKAPPARGGPLADQGRRHPDRPPQEARPAHQDEGDPVHPEDGAADRPQNGPESPDDPHPKGPRGPHPRPPFGEGRPGGPGRPFPPLPPDGPGPRPRGGPESGGPEGSERRPLLRRLIIDRVEAPDFEDDWFSPDRHRAADPNLPQSPR